MTVINNDEIARKLEVAYGIKPGSIRISTIMINNGEANVDGHRRRRRQLDRKKRDIFSELTLARCQQATDSSLDSLLQPRKASKTTAPEVTTPQVTTAKATTAQITTAKATTAQITTAKATTTQATKGKTSTAKAVAPSSK
ncbi:unnamed protein product [Rotaria sordida]|uniref:Uncharacterized protein n=1 Tax=Rotaria sordida TaxID=392033 RepID=A0A814F7V6_9BILA|nr:unnamed protein product [Rotaria sordida]